MIQPTVGRVVWFWPMASDLDRMGATCHDARQPFAATVAYVWHDRMVNLSIVDHTGKQFAERSVTLMQEGDAPLFGNHATWMPYQQVQAKKETV